MNRIDRLVLHLPAGVSRDPAGLARQIGRALADHPPAGTGLRDRVGPVRVSLPPASGQPRLADDIAAAIRAALGGSGTEGTRS